MSPPHATDAELAARASRAAAHGHDPRMVWPGLAGRRYEAARGRIVEAAAAALGGRRGVALHATPGDAPLMGRAAFRLGVGPLLGSWIAARVISASDVVAEVFATHLEHGRRRHATLAVQAARIVELLREAGVEPVLLKGLDSARFYPEPGARVFQDIDLFVPATRARDAEAVLHDQGFVGGPLREGRRRDFTAPGARLASLDLAHADNPWGVDLHYGLRRVFHRALLAELPDPDPGGCAIMRSGDADVLVLPPAMRLALLALHASSSLRLLQLSHLIDIVLAARAASDAAWDELVELLRESGSTRFAYPSLVLAERLAPGAIPGATLARIETGAHARLRRAVRHLPFTGLARQDRWRAVYAFMWAATLREAGLVVWRQLVPQHGRETP